jgi:hypothetical protein
MMEQNICRSVFSDGKHAHHLLHFFCLAVFGTLYHLPLLDGLTPCRACRDSFIRVLPSNGSLEII